MMRAARKTLLPTLIVTELANETDEGAVRVDLAEPFTLPDGSVVTSYHVRPKRPDGADRFDERVDGKARWVPHHFNLFPVVLGSDGAPWAEANVYLMSCLEDTVEPKMRTYESKANDLAAFKRFIDETGLDWTRFPKNKLQRPTYRYSAHLRRAVYAGEIGLTTAQRRMGTVIHFYKFQQAKAFLALENPPWVAGEAYIQIKRPYGSSTILTVETTDLSITVPKQQDPYTDAIEDGGKLHPLPREEQEWLLDALKTLGNTEMTLIHLIGMFTGGRLQTVLTFRVRHVQREISDHSQDDVRIPVGPGTGIDTKHDKKMVLHVPAWLYRMLYIYAHSERARNRRSKAVGGDTEDQYLFLSVRGSPLYHNTEDAVAFDATNTRRHSKTGQAVGQFIRDYIVPFIQAKYRQPQFHFQFHDTRATYGMNLTDDRLQHVTRGEFTLHAAREFVKTRMGHESATTTDRYLNYRKNLHLSRRINSEYADHLQALAEKAMEGLL